MHTPQRRRRTLVHLGTAALTVGLALGAGGCGGENDGVADDSAEAPSATATPTSAAPRDYPAFAPENYTYRLEVLCYCPQIGPVRVTVKDGEVTSATAIRGAAKGTEGPEFVRLTINDIIERANDPTINARDVTWPTGQDYPSVVVLDQVAMATDDEVTYTIKDVREQ